MPLSQQLKSDMTSDRVAPTVESAPEKSAAEVSDDSEFELPITSESENADADTSTLPEKVVAVPATPAEPDILKSIAAQLETLNQNILALSKNVASKQEIDLRPVFARIDSARTSIEELIRVSVSQSAEPKEDNLQKALMMLQSVLEKQEKNDRQLVQTLRENATFQIQVRQGMQKDLDTLKKQLNGEQFEPLLKEIASVYAEYQPLLDDETISERSRKNLNQLFEQLEEILNDYGAETFRSEVGSVRKARVSKVIDKVLTGDEKKHNTIAVSRKPGVVHDRTVLYPEFVDVFVYDPTFAASELAENTEAETANEAAEPIAEDSPAVEATAEPENKVKAEN